MAWIRRHLLAIAGFVSLIPTLVKGAVWLIRAAGDADFVISRLEEPGWIAVLANFFIDPPGWALLATLLLGLGLIYWDTRRTAKPAAAAPTAAINQRELLKALDSLFGDGTRHMNRLIPPIKDYDDRTERDVLDEWQDRALEKMDQLGVSVPIMSRFKTFWKFNPTFHRIAGKNAQQELLEGIWDEKLRQLRIIIDSFDNPRKA